MNKSTQPAGCIGPVGYCGPNSTTSVGARLYGAIANVLIISPVSEPGR